MKEYIINIPLVTNLWLEIGQDLSPLPSLLNFSQVVHTLITASKYLDFVGEHALV